MPSSLSQNPDEQPSLLKILAGVFSGVLFGLLLSKLNSPTDNPTEQDSASVHPKNNPRQEKPPSQFQVPIAAQIPTTPTQHYYPDRRKDNTPTWKKWTKIGAVGVAFFLLVLNIFVTIGTWKAAGAAEQAANWTQRQTQYLFDEQRPFVWVKMLDSFHVEVGKPITARVEVFNYGHTPATVRAYGYIEAGPMIIEKVRDHPLGNAPESKGVRIILLAPGESTKDFPIKTQEKVLTTEDFRLITNGVTDVVIYGHIDYTNPHNPGLQVAKFMSSFCFYRMKDGTVSVCPNYEGAYTNWTP